MLLLNIVEAANRLGVSSTTIRRKLRDDQFGGYAVRVGRRWKIPEDVLLAYNGEPTEEEIGPNWMIPPEEDAVWVVVEEARIRSYVEGLVRELKPDFIVVGVRKGERIVSVMKLVPKEYRERVFHFEYFKLMPRDELQQILENKVILLLDDTMQRGRTLRHVREWFERQLSGKIKVYIACLFVRLEVRNRGQLEIPDVMAYRELDDPTYRLATAELSCYHSYLWPLDENHPMVWVEMPSTISDESLDTTLSELGRLLEMPVPVQDKNIRMLVIDLVKAPMWRSLGLPKTAHEWPNKKLRLIWDKEKSRLLITGIWFPTLKATIRWLTTYHPSPSDPWYPYMSIQDTATWRRLDPDQQALSLFNAWAIYSGTKLICTAVAELLTGFPEEIPSDIRKWNVEQEDFIRSFGKQCAKRIKATIQSEIQKTLEFSTQARITGPEMPLRTTAPLPVMQKALTIHDHVRPLVELLKQRASEREEKEDTAFGGVSYEELREALGEDVDLILDIALDYGFTKPTNLISRIGNFITVQRGYKDTEKDADPKSNSPGSSQLVEQRLVSAVHLLCHSFESCNPGDSLHQLAFNKFLVNVQANRAKGNINPSNRNGINHIFIREVAREFGPMAYTPATLTPTTTVPIVSFLHDRGRIKNLIDDQEKSLPIILTRPTQIEQVLISIQEAWSPDEETVTKDVGLLCELHAKGTLGQGIPTKGNLLTALVACSSEQRYVYYGFNLVRIWSASASMVMNRLGEKVRSKIAEASVEPDLVRMLRAGASLSDKTKWYRTLTDWRNSIERVRVEPDLLMAKQRLLGRIEHTPNLQRESICRSVMDIEPLVRLVGTLLRYAVTQAGLVTDSEYAKKPKGAQPRDGFRPADDGVEPCNFAEVCIMLHVQGPIEIEKAQTALDRVASLSDKTEINADVLRDLTRVWDTVCSIINDTEQTIQRKGYKLE
jgi:excisionase family DNA binding protein